MTNRRRKLIPLSEARRCAIVAEDEFTEEKIENPKNQDDGFDTIPRCLRQKFGLHSLLCAHPESDVYERCDIPMPAEIIARYKELHDGQEIVARGSGFPYTLQKLEIKGREYYHGLIYESANGPDLMAFYLYPVNQIDINS